MIFLGEFSHCGYKENLKKIHFNSVNFRKKMHIKWKGRQSLQTTKLRKEGKEKNTCCETKGNF